MTRLSMLRHHAIAAAVLCAFAPAAGAAVFTWSSGDFIPGVTAPSPLGGADVLNIESGGFKYFNGAGSNFTNGGTVNWNADSLYLQSGVMVVNSALWNSTSDTSMIYNGGSAPSFINSGVFRKSDGLGSTTIGDTVGFVNNGTLDAQIGSIAFVGGSVFNAGSVFTGAGVVTMAGGTNTFSGSFSSANLVLQGGNHSGNGAVLGGKVAWTGGIVSGTWTVAAGQTLNGETGGFKYLSNAGTTLTNLGTIAWNTTDNLYLQSSGAVSNQGLFVANADTALIYNGGAGPSFDNTASGTVRAAAGKTLTIANTVGFANNAGVLDAQAGGAIVYAGGSVFNAGTKFTGAGSNVATASNSWSGAFDSANLVLQGGTHGGNGAVLGGKVAWTGGIVSGTWTVAAGQTLNGETGGFKYLSNAGTTLTNLGTIAWNTTDNLYLQSSGAVSNQGLFVANADTALIYNGGAGPSFDNTASGTVRAAAGKTLTIANTVGFVNNAGVLDAQAGGAIVYAGGSVFNAGTKFTGAGSNVATSSNNWNGAFDSANLVLQGGTHSGNGAVLGGKVAWTGGIVSGTWTVAAGQTLNGETGGFKYLSNAGTTLTNLGTIAWNTTDNVYVQSSATLVNQGRIEFGADASVLYNGGATPSFVNDGLIVKSAGSGTTTISDTLGFSNPGTVDVRSGAIALPSNFVNAGKLTGTGAFAAAGTLVNNGHIAPGASPGMLTINANLALAAPGSLDIEVENLSSHDLLTVNGNTSLDGVLAVSCFGSCSFAVGDQFRVLDGSGALDGSFAGLALIGFATGNFDILYDRPLGDVWLKVTETVSAVPEPGTAALLFGGLVMVGWLVRRRRVA